MTKRKTNIPSFGVIAKYNESWRKFANCRNVSKDVFIIGRGESAKTALSYCKSCTVQKACLTYAIDNHCIGIWGNTTNKTRRLLRRREKFALQKEKK
jgi:hypothetical protein